MHKHYAYRCGRAKSHFESVPVNKGTARPPLSEAVTAPARGVAIVGNIYQDAYLAPLNPDSEFVLIPKIGHG